MTAPLSGKWFIEKERTQDGCHVNISTEFHGAFATVVVRMQDEAVDAPHLVATANVIVAARELLDACKEQHQAIDMLLALLINADPKFRPSQQTELWAVVKQGHKAIEKAEGGAK